MADDARTPEGSFLQRWSRRKHAASRDIAPTPSAPAPVAPLIAQVTSEPVPADVASPAGAATGTQPDKELPSVDSLSFESDFTAFLKPGVDGATRQQALKKLFSDARFNVMDGLDVYIDDYSKFEPMTPEILEQLAHARYLFDPPKTRVNALGHGEDVVDQETPAEREALQAGDDALVPDTALAQAASATGSGACATDTTEATTIPPLSVASATDERR